MILHGFAWGSSKNKCSRTNNLRFNKEFKKIPQQSSKICKDTGLKFHYLENPCLYLKAKKNLVEIEGAKKANIRDGVTISKFLYWLKNKIDIDKMDEIKSLFSNEE